jgi:hypothetical protein
MPGASNDGIDGVGRIAFRENPRAVTRLERAASRLDPIEFGGIHTLECYDIKQRRHGHPRLKVVTGF